MKSRTLKIILALIILVCVFPIYKGLSATMQARHASSPGTTLDDGLVGHWTFDGADMTSGTALDKSGSNNTGTLTNMSTSSRVAGVLGQGLQFDGDNDYVYGGSGASLDDLNIMTLTGWIKVEPGNYGVIVQKDGGASLFGWYLWGGDSLLQFSRDFTGGAGYGRWETSAGTIPPNEWVFFTVTYNKSSSVNDPVFYLNGIQVSNTETLAPSGSARADTSGSVYIGNRSGIDYGFKGIIDDVRVYNRALSADEIHQLYKMGEGATMGVDPTSDSLAEGLAGYWKFDEASGSTTIDSSVNRNNGTTTNMDPSTKWTSGKIGSGLMFDGTDDYVTVAGSPSINNLTNFTASFWVKSPTTPNTSNTTQIINKKNNTYSSITFSWNHSSPFMQACASYSASSGWVAAKLTSALQDNVWYHITCSYDGSFLRAYLNGSLEASSPMIGLDGGNDPLTIGSGPGASYFPGSIDEVRIYNRALSADEIATLYRTTKPTEVDASLVGHWTFDGPTISGTTVRDLSGAGNNGTLTNGPTKTVGVLGQGLNFDGNTGGQKVNAGSATNLDDLGPLTISTWIYPRSIGMNSLGVIALKSDTWNLGTGWILRYASTNKIVFGVKYSTTNLIREINTGLLQFNTWQHVVVTWDGSTTASNVHIYINGTEATYLTTTNASGSRVSDASELLYFGNDNSGNTTFDGSLDDVHIYNRALSADEIYKMYKVGAGSKMNVDTVTPDLERGLAGYWPLDNGSGVTASDLSVNGNNGTLTNGPTWSTGKIGGAVTFDGTDDYIDTGTKMSFTDAVTVSAWVNASASVDSMPIVGHINGQMGSDGQVLSFDNAGVNNIAFTANGTLISVQTENLGTNTWHHVIYTNQGTTHKLYLDGSKIYETITALSGLSSAAEDNIAIGRSRSTESNAVYFNGKIDEVRLYNRALSQDEITQLYRTTKPTLASDGLVGYWPFNGPDVTDKVYDRSGAGNNGYFVGGATTSAKTIGQVGQGLQFDGVDDYVNAPSSLPTLNTYTSCAWVKPNFSMYTSGSTYTVVARQQDPGDTNRSAEIIFSGIEYGWFSDSASAYSYLVSRDITPFNPGEWHHICFSFGGAINTGQFYWDGVAKTTTQTVYYAGANDTSNLSFNIGRKPNGSYWDGSIDEVRIYNRVLSAQEVKQLYSAGR